MDKIFRFFNAPKFWHYIGYPLLGIIALSLLVAVAIGSLFAIIERHST